MFQPVPDTAVSPVQRGFQGDVQRGHTGARAMSELAHGFMGAAQGARALTDLRTETRGNPCAGHPLSARVSGQRAELCVWFG